MGHNTNADTDATPRTDGFELRRVHLEAPDHGWGAPLGSLDSADQSPRVYARERLGLDPTRPVIASGHQPVVMHMGIVAKLIAMDAWATTHNATPLWVVPDMDEVDPSIVHVPESSRDELIRREITLGEDPAGTGPAMTMPPIKNAARRDESHAFETLGALLDAYAHEPTRAKQFASAVIDDLCEQLGIEAPTILYASDLMGFDFAQDILQTMREDPIACVQAYNDAIEQSDDAGVRPLSIDGTRVELPLWRVEGDTRSRVYSDDPALGVDIGQHTLVPRGLLMTAIVRLALCDAFIHGTGGMRYDRITERWIKLWIGRDLAPIAGVSATATLALELPSSYTDPDRALWEAHHARHDPEMVDEQAAAARKTELVTKIASAKANGEDPDAMFRELQSLLNTTRAEHASDLESFDEQAADAQRYRAMHEIATARTWAYPLFPKEALLALRDQIRSEMR